MTKTQANGCRELMLIDTIGWIGGVMLALCAAPQAIQCYKQKHAKGLNWGLILLWYIGEILLLIYTIMRHGLDLPLLFNYGLNIVLLTYIIRIKLGE